MSPMCYLLNTNLKFIQVVSLDPATDNFAIVVERRWCTGVIETLYNNKVKVDRNIDAQGVMKMFSQIIEHMETIAHYFDETSLFLVERQMHINFNATRVVHIVFGYITSYIMKTKSNPNRRHCVLVELNPKVKGTMLGSPKGCDKPTLKKWGINTAIALYIARGDQKAFNYINSITKKDDIADATIQIEAFFKLIGLPLTGVPWQLSTSFNLNIVNIHDNDDDIYVVLGEIEDSTSMYEIVDD